MKVLAKVLKSIMAIAMLAIIGASIYMASAPVWTGKMWADYGITVVVAGVVLFLAVGIYTAGKVEKG